MGQVPPNLVFEERRGRFLCPRCSALSPRLVATLGIRSYEQCAACGACYVIRREWLFRSSLVVGASLLAAAVLRFALLSSVAIGSLTPTGALAAYAFVFVGSALSLFNPLRRIRQLHYVCRLAT
jgi:hypothetical protein